MPPTTNPTTGQESSPGRRPAAVANKTPLRVAAIVVVVVAAVTMIVFGSEGGRVRGEFTSIAQLRADGQLEHAAAAIARLREEWAGATDDRLEKLAAEQAQIDAILAAEQQLTARIVDPELERGLPAWTVELQRIEANGEPAERIAAGRLIGKVEALLRGKPKPRPKAPVAATEAPKTRTADEVRAFESVPPPAPLPASPAKKDGVAKNDAPAAAPAPGAKAAVSTETTLAEARRLADKGLFGQALALLREELATADAGAGKAAQVQKEIDVVTTAARSAMATLLASAERSMTAQRPGEALTLLAAARHRFPLTAEFHPLLKAIQKAQAAAVALAEKAEEEEDGDPAAVARRAAAGAEKPEPAESAKPAGADEPASATRLRGKMDSIRAAEERGAFADAARGLHEVAELVHATDPAFATRLEARAAEAELLAAWHQSVAAALTTGRSVKVVSIAGRAVTLKAAQGVQLVGTAANETVHLTWSEVSSFGVDLLAESVQPIGDAVLGAATLLYRLGDRERAESLLTKAWQADAKLKAGIDGVLARGRNEPVDSRGYSLGKDGFVSARSLELQKEALKLAPKIDAALAERDAKVRDKALAEVVGNGPDAAALLTTALKKQFEQRIQKIAATNLDKQLAKLGEQRALLEKARNDAKTLIWDEVRYFYPYRPPAVSSDKFAEYNRVQQEVNRVVAALRTVWNDDHVKVRVPATLRADVERIDWLAKKLGELGALDPAALARIEWARTLPPGDTVGLHDHCATVAERVELEEWRRIDAYNQAIGKKVPSAVRELLQITNDYRAMFRHRPLALVKQLCDASQGHADEMDRLGYMAHMSPTAGRVTPWDRMQLAGYTSGVSENLALHDGALGAHNGWCGSSGHHRNLLDPGHTELGVGCNGRLWVQNFGTGLVHRETVEWKEVVGETGAR